MANTVVPCNAQQGLLIEVRTELIGFRKVIYILISIAIVVVIASLALLAFDLDLFESKNPVYSEMLKMGISAVSGTLTIPMVVFVYRTGVAIRQYNYVISIACQNPEHPDVKKMMMENPIAFVK